MDALPDMKSIFISLLLGAAGAFCFANLKAAQPIKDAVLQTPLNAGGFTIDNLGGLTFSGTGLDQTKIQLGIDGIDNTADLAKPISNATQAALDEKPEVDSPNAWFAPQTLLAGLGTTFEGSRTIYVSTGSLSTDSRAGMSKYDATKPFASVAAAQSAAVAGDTILVQSGTYTGSGLGKDRVNWYFAPGATIFTSGVSNTAIFSDSGTSMSFAVGGYLSATISCFNPSGTTSPVVRVTNPESKIFIEAGYLSAFDLDAAGDARTVLVDDGELTMRVSVLEGSGNIAVLSNGGTLIVSADEARGETVFDVEAGYANITVGILRNTSVGISNGGSGNPIVNARIGQAQPYWGAILFYFTSGTLTGSVGTSEQLLTSSGGDFSTKMIINAGVVSIPEATQAAISSDGGEVIVTVDYLITDGQIASRTNSGFLDVNCRAATTSFSGDAIASLDSGSTRLSGRFETTAENPFLTDWSGNLILDGARIIVPLSQSYSFAPSSSKILKVLTGYSNKPVNGNVTEQIGTLVSSSEVQ